MSYPVTGCWRTLLCPVTRCNSLSILPDWATDKESAQLPFHRPAPKCKERQHATASTTANPQIIVNLVPYNLPHHSPTTQHITTLSILFAVHSVLLEDHHRRSLISFSQLSSTCDAPTPGIPTSARCQTSKLHYSTDNTQTLL